jgi:hypothetical protein
MKRQWIGIDISPTACRVMAKRLRDVCALPESEPLWRAGRGFVVRDLPWTVERLRAIPPFKFVHDLPHPGLLPKEKVNRPPSP